MDEIDGITLDKLTEYSSRYAAFREQYDELSAKAAFEVWLTQQGTTSDRYFRAHEGWAARFRDDPSGELEASSQRMLAAHRQALHDSAEDEPPPPSLEHSPDQLVEQLSSSSRAARWKAARLLAHAIDFGKAKGEQYRAACVPVLLEILDQHDEHTAADAEDAARRLLDIGERTPEVRSSVARCLRRAEDELVSLEAALNPIQNSSSPEPTALRSRIASYRSLVESLRGYLQDLLESQVTSFAPPAAATVSAAAASRRPGKGGTGAGIALTLLAVLLVGGATAALLLSHRPSAAPTVSLNAALVPSAAPSAALSAGPHAPTHVGAAALEERRR